MGSSQQGVQLTNEFSDPPTTGRCGRVASQDVHYDRMRKNPRLGDLAGANICVVSGGEFERACRVAG